MQVPIDIVTKLHRDQNAVKSKPGRDQMLVIKMIARHPNCGKPLLRAYNITLFWKQFRGTQLIAGSNGKKL